MAILLIPIKLVTTLIKVNTLSMQKDKTLEIKEMLIGLSLLKMSITLDKLYLSFLLIMVILQPLRTIMINTQDGI